MTVAPNNASRPGTAGILAGAAASPACSGGVVRAVGKITVVARDGASPSKTNFRETSTFDAAA